MTDPASRKTKQPLSAWDRALKILGGRRQSERELRRKLVQRGHEADEVEEVIERLYELRYLDDEAAVRDWAEELARNGGQGRRRAEQKLIQRGLAPDRVRLALEQAWDDETEQLHLDRELNRRLGRNPDAAASREARGKLYQALLRKGFAAGLVRRALDRLAHGEDDFLGD